MKRRGFLNVSPEINQPQPMKQHGSIISIPEAGYPREYKRHSWILVEDVRAWLGRDSLGFYAIDATCPHLGGMVRFHEDAFTCPCHGSSYSTSGSVKGGPASYPLRFLYVDLDANGKLVIHRDRLVSPDDRFIA